MVASGTSDSLASSNHSLSFELNATIGLGIAMTLDGQTTTQQQLFKQSPGVPIQALQIFNVQNIRLQQPKYPLLGNLHSQGAGIARH
ncbi:hypothetical protein [Methylogaea oryzae]|uniref:Uncharacterized protein n=1 Tax=Methylogaea oryzae TaxID=1295382 RepID=A0A8D5AP74_9GAMM|nr:hypothetical protein [Methylogaea oryzae]BBL72780.1 hypothetical protein MoryE10_33860 [Methylogaea oryzae]